MTSSVNQQSLMLLTSKKHNNGEMSAVWDGIVERHKDACKFAEDEISPSQGQRHSGLWSEHLA